MQTTLLGLAIAIILALVTALVGPFFVDWGRYRSTFEAEATRLIGQNVRVTGPIDMRLLPAPSLRIARRKRPSAQSASKMMIQHHRDAAMRIVITAFTTGPACMNMSTGDISPPCISITHL